jgi:S-formylglutathione hydrolase FrmB
VFADSANNGPYGEALIKELIPAVERKVNALGTPAGRFVMGHSSGGWSSLWLQVRYPDFFGGVWSTAPDPVDFHDFQRINLYADDSMFTDPQGRLRPLARRGDEPVVWYQDFSDMEVPLGRGEQLGSFEAVFSRRDRSGQPERVWDRKTGRIDHKVAESWKPFDIRERLEKNWKTLGPKLAGKLHVHTGGLDTFYLEGAVVRLKDTLARLGSDAIIEVVPGKDHGSLMDVQMRKRIADEIAAAARKAGG